MSKISLGDILINARQESIRMRHYYLGVEHLFISLLEIQGGLTTAILEEYGITARYIVDAIRRVAGKGNRQRLWAGMPNTPRADVVMSIANDLALEDRRTEISERDVLIAILDESDSIPIRVLKRLRISPQALLEKAKNAPSEQIASLNPPYTRIEFGEQFDSAQSITDEHVFVLRRMFFSHAAVRVERRLPGGYSSAVLFVVTPINADNTTDSPIVIKIDRTDNILEEAARYESHVKSSLPPLTARIEDKPIVVETSDFAALRYTFVTDANGYSRDLREAAQYLPDLATWLKNILFPYFGKTWWMQRSPYRFQVWMEYDWLLPPLLILEHIAENDAPEEAFTISDPVKRARLQKLDYGAVVIVDGFSVNRVYRDQNMIQLTLGKGAEASKKAYKIQVKGINLSEYAFFRGEVVERLAGRVYETRTALMLQALNALEPDFDPTDDLIPGSDKSVRLPNPLMVYDNALDEFYNGSISKIHGDLHLGNILVGVDQNPFLIDFAQTRNGHTLSDWAMLEVSLLNDLVMPSQGDTWGTARAILGYISLINRGKEIPSTAGEIRQMLAPIQAVRSIVNQCLAKTETRAEYFIALAMCALRAYEWDTISLGARRLMFCLAALSFYELQQMPRSSESGADSRTSIWNE